MPFPRNPDQSEEKRKYNRVRMRLYRAKLRKLRGLDKKAEVKRENNERKVLALSHVDLGYIAGLVDGEGTITIREKSRWETGRREGLQPIVAVSNTIREPLNFLKDKLGGSVSKVGGRMLDKRKQPYQWGTVSPTIIEPLMKRLLPILKIKRQQAQLMLEFLEKRTIRSSAGGAFWEPLPNLDKRFKERINALNKKGISYAKQKNAS